MYLKANNFKREVAIKSSTRDKSVSFDLFPVKVLIDGFVELDKK